MPSRLADPTHWGNRADEARAIAGQFRDRDARRIMLDIAASYDRMAELAQSWLIASEDNPVGR